MHTTYYSISLDPATHIHTRWGERERAGVGILKAVDYLEHDVIRNWINLIDVAIYRQARSTGQT